MPAPPVLGEADVDAAAVVVAQRALDQAVLFEPADHPGQGALAQVHGLGQLLHPEQMPRILGETLQHLELGDPKAVPFAQIVFQGRAHRRVARCERAPLLGAATVTAGMLLLVYAVVSAPQAGWTSPRTLVSFAAAIALLGAFVAIERRSRDPLVRLGIFRSGALTRANLAAMMLFGSYVAFQFLVTQYLQIMAGWSALGTAMAFLPAGVLGAVASPRMGPVLDRFGPARVAAAGFACLVAGYTLFLRIGPAPDYPAVILPSLLLIGAAFGLGFAALNILATAGVAGHEQGLASGIFQTSFQVGGAVVLAIITAVIDARGADHAVSASTLAAYRPALAVITGVAVLGLGVALTGLRAPRPRPALAAPDPDADEAELEPVGR
jgi:MFS transporter